MLLEFEAFNSLYINLCTWLLFFTFVFLYYFSAHKSLAGFSDGFSDDRNITIQKQKPQLYG